MVKGSIESTMIVNNMHTSYGCNKTSNSFLTIEWTGITCELPIQHAASVGERMNECRNFRSVFTVASLSAVLLVESALTF